MNVLKIGVIVLLFAGCASAGVVQRVEVPIPVPCNPPVVQAPALPVDSMGGAEMRDGLPSNIFEINRAMWATIEALEGYSAQLEAAIEACRKP